MIFVYNYVIIYKNELVNMLIFNQSSLYYVLLKKIRIKMHPFQFMVTDLLVIFDSKIQLNNEILLIFFHITLCSNFSLFYSF